MKTGPQGIALLHHYEMLVLVAYPDPASPMGRALLEGGYWVRFLAGKIGLEALPLKIRVLSGTPWTIGYGDTGPDVVPGLKITEADANARFERRLTREFEPGVQAMLKRAPTQQQFDALVSFAYNLGLGNLRSSTLLRYFNAGSVAAAGAQFLSWNRAAGKRMLGLTRRRNAEKWVFEGASAADAIALAEKIEVA
jgi:lysozyme